MRYWFPAKRYGWGWGAPATWQGWAVLGVYVALILAGAVVIDPATRLGAFIAWGVVWTALLLWVCFRTGEPPRWRWGKP
jgi:hypothetical protein